MAKSPWYQSRSGVAPSMQSNPTMNRSQVDQTQIQTEDRQFGQTLDYKRESRDMGYSWIEKLMKLFGGGAGGGNNSFEAPLQAMIDANSPTGSRMDASKALAHEQGQKALAAGQVSLTGTGMSSGTNVAGLGARIGHDTTLANQRALLGFGAQQDQGQMALAQGRLTQQQIASNAQQQMMRTLSMFT